MEAREVAIKGCLFRFFPVLLSSLVCLLLSGCPGDKAEGMFGEDGRVWDLNAGPPGRQGPLMPGGGGEDGGGVEEGEGGGDGDGGGVFDKTKILDKAVNTGKGGIDKTLVDKSPVDKGASADKDPDITKPPAGAQTCTGEGQVFDAAANRCDCDRGRHYYRSPFIRGSFGGRELLCLKKIRELKVRIGASVSPGNAGTYQLDRVRFIVSNDNIFDTIFSVGDRNWILGNFFAGNTIEAGGAKTSTLNARGDYTYYDDPFVTDRYYPNFTEEDWAVLDEYRAQGSPLLYPDGIRHFRISPMDFPTDNQLTDDLFIASVELQACVEGVDVCYLVYEHRCVNQWIRCRGDWCGDLYLSSTHNTSDHPQCPRFFGP